MKDEIQWQKRVYVIRKGSRRPFVPRPLDIPLILEAQRKFTEEQEAALDREVERLALAQMGWNKTLDAR